MMMTEDSMIRWSLIKIQLIKKLRLENDTFLVLSLIMAFSSPRNKHLCMRAFVYGDSTVEWRGRNFSSDNEATMRPNLDRGN